MQDKCEAIYLTPLSYNGEPILVWMWSDLRLTGPSLHVPDGRYVMETVEDGDKTITIRNNVITRIREAV
jgi:hypothetical protein